MNERTILHVDANNFYASVECMLHPELRGYPIAVCGDVEERHGIVLAKNYSAKAYGISTGEAIWQAKQKCKDLIIVPPHYDDYMKISKAARDIYCDYTDKVEPFGMDECWLQLWGKKYDERDGINTANAIRDRIKVELGITVSVGVSFNKVFAKLGSDLKKPDAVTVVPKDSFQEKIWGLPASDMLGVGRATEKKLASVGIRTIGDMATWPVEYFEHKLGKNGVMLWGFANGMDTSPVENKDYEMLDKSCGHGITTLQDLENAGEVWNIMLELSQDIGHRLREGNKKATGVAIMIRDSELMTRQWQCGVNLPTYSPTIIAKEAFSLFQRSYSWQRPIRSVTVRAINLAPADGSFQLDLFTDAEKQAKAEALDKAIDDLRMRFGKHIIRNACLLNNPKMPDFEHKITMPNGVPC